MHSLKACSPSEVETRKACGQGNFIWDSEVKHLLTFGHLEPKTYPVLQQSLCHIGFAILPSYCDFD